MEGRLVRGFRIKADAVPLGGGKEVWDDDDYEAFEEVVPYTDQELAELQEVQEQAESEAQLRSAMSIALKSLDLPDEDIQKIPLMFPAWTVGTAYSQGDIVRYDGELYRVSQAHTSQPHYLPSTAVSLYKRIGEPDDQGVFPWSQPQGAHDAYKKGDKVLYNGVVWVSTLDANVWAPDVQGWDKE